MIIRIVKMTFDPDVVDDFLGIFNESRDQIAGFKGCEKLQLWQDVNNDNVCVTYSIWQSQEALELYRQSELFENTWGRAKQLFAEKPEVMTLQEVN